MFGRDFVHLDVRLGVEVGVGLRCRWVVDGTEEIVCPLLTFTGNGGGNRTTGFVFVSLPVLSLCLSSGQGDVSVREHKR